jgi:hypothetical protein
MYFPPERDRTINVGWIVHCIQLCIPRGTVLATYKMYNLYDKRSSIENKCNIVHVQVYLLVLYHNSRSNILVRLMRKIKLLSNEL